MKNIILLILSMIMLTSLKAQTTYPAYYVKDGDTVGVVFTIEQAQKIDNDLELLKMLKIMRSNFDKTEASYISVIDNYGKQVALLDIKITAMDTIISTQKSMINNLNLQIDNYKKDQTLAKSQSDLKDEIIKNQKKQIRKQKVQKVVGFGAGIIGIILVILLSQ